MRGSLTHRTAAIAVVAVVGAATRAAIQLPDPVKNEVSVYTLVTDPEIELFDGLRGLYSGVYGSTSDGPGAPSAAFLPYVRREATPPLAVPIAPEATATNPYANLFGDPVWSGGASAPASYAPGPAGFGSPYTESGYRPAYAPPPVSSYGPEPVLGSENLESWGYHPQGTRGD